MPATGNKSYHPLTLSIRIYADGFSFFVCDPQTSNLVRGEHFQLGNEPMAARLQQELSKSDYNNRQIDQVYVLVCTPSIHVPLEEFHRDEASALYAFALADQDMSRLRVAYTIQPELESVEVYAVARDVEEAILQFFPTARFFASRAMLMERLKRYDDTADSHSRRLFACVSHEGLEIIAFSDGHLHFANTFETSVNADIQYFALNTWQMLGFDAEQDYLVLIVETGDEQAQALQTAFAAYVRHIEALSSSALFSHVPLASETQVPLDLKALLLNRL